MASSLCLCGFGTSEMIFDAARSSSCRSCRVGIPRCRNWRRALRRWREY
jgi:hypothetical protein